MVMLSQDHRGNNGTIKQPLIKFECVLGMVILKELGISQIQNMIPNEGLLFRV